MKNVFVTGASGLVGTYLVRTLVQAGYRVRALRRSHSRLELHRPWLDAVEWIEGDLLDAPLLEEALQGMDQVYHAAALVSFQPKHAELVLRTNAEGTANLVNAALYAGVEKFLHISSIAALGRKDNQTHLNEQTQWENNALNSQYAISKFKAECEVWRAMEEGLPAVIINPGLIFGSGFWDLGTGTLVQRVWRGLRFFPKGASCLVDVRDVVRAAVQLMNSPIAGERFILCSANWSYQQLFSTLAQHLGVRAPSHAAANWMLELAWRWEWLRSRALGLPPNLTRETARTAQGTYIYSNQKIIQQLCFQFLPPEQTLRETALAFLQTQQNGKLPDLLPMPEWDSSFRNF